MQISCYRREAVMADREDAEAANGQAELLSRAEPDRHARLWEPHEGGLPVC